MRNHLFSLKNQNLKPSNHIGQLDLSQHVIKQAAAGNLAIHVNSDFGLLAYKLDDPAILGNLREDGGTLLTDMGERQKKDFQFYTTVSTTLLPPSEYPIAQNLYSYANDVFIGLDITRSIIKNFSLGDGQSTYEYKNKHGRPSYKMLFFTGELQLNKSSKDRYAYVNKLNHESAQRCIVKGKGSFGKKPDFKRSMNELLLKVNLSSMVCIGSTVDEVLAVPEIILKLITIQQNFKRQLGMDYPIMIYNNDKFNQSIDFLDEAVINFQPNQFVAIDVMKTLKAMASKFSDQIKSERYNKEFSIKEIESLYLTENSKDGVSIYNDYVVKVATALKFLNERLPEYSEEDKVILVHKENDNNANEYQSYLEINQSNLKFFIQNKILTTENFNPDTMILLAKAYNLQFRLSMYEKLLDNHSLVNYENINQDLHWLTEVMKKLSAIDFSIKSTIGVNPK